MFMTISMNYYQNSIKTGIFLIILVCNTFNCYNQEVRPLKIDNGNGKIEKYAPFLEARSNLFIWTQREVGTNGDTLDKLYFKNLLAQSSETEPFEILNIPFPLSSIGTCNISFDGSTIVFAGARIQKDTTWYILLGKKENNRYQYSQTITSGKFWMGHPCLALNDSMIVFSSLRNVSQKTDLYFVKRIEDDKWNEPKPISDNINTTFDELSPFLSYKNNNLLLYFSSDRPNGKGGLDLYVSQFKFSDKSWSKPNLIPIVNTEFDDAFPSTPHDTSAEDILYFASNRGADKSWNLYSASPNPAPPVYIIVEGTVSNVSLQNQITPVKNANIIFRNFNSSKHLAMLSSDSIGHYIATMPLDVKLYVEAYTSGKANKDTLVYYSSEKLKSMQHVRLDFFLKDTFSLVTDTVFFDYKKADLKINSKVELILQRISDYLKMNPKNQIKIVGHTDKIGGYNYNIDLSERRARAVVDTLINRGIDSSYFISEGKAYLQPLPGLENCVKEDCAPNRRVEVFYLYRKE